MPRVWTVAMRRYSLEKDGLFAKCATPKIRVLNVKNTLGMRKLSMSGFWWCRGDAVLGVTRALWQSHINA